MTPSFDTAPVHPEWPRFLAELEGAGFARCFISGGAVRDIALDRDPKDLDVFVPWSRGLSGDFAGFVDLCKKLAAGNENIEVIRQYDTGYADEADHTVLGAVTLKVAYLPYEAQLIAIDRAPNDPWEIDVALKRIDFGICRAAWGLQEGFCFDRTFIQDIMAGRITLLRCDSWAQFRGSCRRYWRFLDKYNCPLYIEGYQVPMPLVRRVIDNHPMFVSLTQRMGSGPSAATVRSLAACLGH